MAVPKSTTSASFGHERRPHRGGEAVGAERFGRIVAVADRHGRRRCKFQTLHGTHPQHPRQRCGTASGRGDNGPVDRRPARQQAVEQFGVALLGEQFLDDFTPVENRHFYQRIADVDRQVHASCSLYNDFSISHAPAMSVTPLTVIAKRLLCCLSTNLSGRRVTRRNSSEKTSLL